MTRYLIILGLSIAPLTLLSVATLRGDTDDRRVAEAVIGENHVDVSLIMDEVALLRPKNDADIETLSAVVDVNPLGDRFYGKQGAMELETIKGIGAASRRLSGGLDGAIRLSRAKGIACEFLKCESSTFGGDRRRTALEAVRGELVSATGLNAAEVLDYAIEVRLQRIDDEATIGDILTKAKEAFDLKEYSACLAKLRELSGFDLEDGERQVASTLEQRAQFRSGAENIARPGDLHALSDLQDWRRQLEDIIQRFTPPPPGELTLYRGLQAEQSEAEARVALGTYLNKYKTRATTTADVMQRRIDEATQLGADPTVARFGFLRQELRDNIEQWLMRLVQKKVQIGFGLYQEALRDTGKWERGTWRRQTETTLAFLPIGGSTDFTRTAIQYTIQPREIESERLIKSFNAAVEKLHTGSGWKVEQNWKGLLTVCQQCQEDLKEYRAAGGLAEKHKDLSFAEDLQVVQDICLRWQSLARLFEVLEGS